jgi:hypothetical protein
MKNKVEKNHGKHDDSYEYALNVYQKINENLLRV